MMHAVETLLAAQTALLSAAAAPEGGAVAGTPLPLSADVVARSQAGVAGQGPPGVVAQEQADVASGGQAPATGQAQAGVAGQGQAARAAGGEAAVAAQGQAATAAQGQAVAAQGQAAAIAQGQAAAIAFSYLPYTNAARSFASSMRARDASDEEGEDALVSRFGSQLPLIIGALPSSIAGQFVAQLTAASGSAGGDAAAEEGNAVLSESELATLVASGITSKDETLHSALASRLALYVARHGAAPAAAALHRAHHPLVFAAAATTPQATHLHARVARPDDDRERQRHERRQPYNEPEPTAAREDEAPGYTIEDAVRLGGTTIATHRMAAPHPIDERNSP